MSDESVTLADLEREAWRLCAIGDRRNIERFATASHVKGMIMSGRIKVHGRPVEAKLEEGNTEWKR